MHRGLDILAEKGYVILQDRRDRRFRTPSGSHWPTFWKSGGDTNFAPLASATGEMDCRGFWVHGKADMDGIWTMDRTLAPSLASYENVG